MKAVRLITCLVVAILVFSAWTPTPVLAKADVATTSIIPNSVSSIGDFATTKPVKMTIVNNTGGFIYIRLTGTKAYYFSAGAGKNTFMIAPGKYLVTLTTSACKGAVTKKNFTGGSLGTYRCR